MVHDILYSFEKIVHVYKLNECAGEIFSLTLFFVVSNISNNASEPSWIWEDFSDSNQGSFGKTMTCVGPQGD